VQLSQEVATRWQKWRAGHNGGQVMNHVSRSNRILYNCLATQQILYPHISLTLNIRRTSPIRLLDLGLVDRAMRKLIHLGILELPRRHLVVKQQIDLTERPSFRLW